MGYWTRRRAQLGIHSIETFHGSRHVHPTHLAEDDVLAIQPGSRDCSDEELRAIGVPAGVGHRKQTRLGAVDAQAQSGGAWRLRALAIRLVHVTKVIIPYRLPTRLAMMSKSFC